MVKNISPKELKTRLDAGESIPVIDVREDWELDITKLGFATHIPMDEIPERAAEVPQDVPVVILCKAGGRSSRVVDYLESMGYTNLLNLDGGILAWAAEVDPSMPRSYR